jgi:hypothetical protein
MTLIGWSAVAVTGVAALVSGLLMGHVIGLSQLTANQSAPMGTTTAALDTYPGQQQRGVFQAINRVVASGGTIVTLGSQASDGTVRPQFIVSADGGHTWRLAPLRAVGGGAVPLGHAAGLLAGGPGGWLAVGPQAIWSSHDGTAWTLTSTHGITPQLPGDSVWVITKTAAGFLAAGRGNAVGGGTQAVIWTSDDGRRPGPGGARRGRAEHVLRHLPGRRDGDRRHGRRGRRDLLRRVAEHERRVGVDPGEHTGQ